MYSNSDPSHFNTGGYTLKRSWPLSKEEVEERRRNRELLTDHVRKTFNFTRTEQSNRVKEPPFEKPLEEGKEIIELPEMGNWAEICDIGLADALASRKSRRSFSDLPLKMEELSFLLWATQGIRDGGPHHFRTVPSAGARHSFETYICSGNVEGLEKAVYRYIPSKHALIELRLKKEIMKELTSACFGQMFISKAAVGFVWTTIPYRMEWRYGPAAHRVIAIDIGHVCQNLYLAVEGIGAGTCGIGAYDQDRIDRLIGVDGEDEFVIYVAPVGKR